MSRMASVPPPTHRFAGTSRERQETGLPGHCEPCAVFGHVIAHPNLGCSDVGCDKPHGDETDTPGSGIVEVVASPPGDGHPDGRSVGTAVLIKSGDFGSWFESARRAGGRVFARRVTVHVDWTEIGVEQDLCGQNGHSFT